MTTYFQVSIVEAPGVAYEEHSDAGVMYLDANGVPVEVTAFPLHYTDRHWVDNTAQAWMVPAPEQPVVERVITTKAFLLRFTGEERVAVRTAARASVSIDDWLHLLESDTIVHLNSVFMVNGMAAIVAAGFITQARSDEIINAEIQPFEVPNA
jgi:hypothetical protein